MDKSMELLEAKAYIESQLNHQINGADKRPICLLGAMHTSPFLQAVWRKAVKHAFDVRYMLHARQCSASTAIIVDKETYAHKDTMPTLSRVSDVDGYQHADIMSACAGATFALLNECYMLPALKVVIIGRGHAVQGLANILLRQSATVTVCNSYTDSTYLQKLCEAADVVVNSAPVLPVHINTKTLIDIGRVSSYSAEAYMGQLGSLTTTLLLSRCTFGGEQDA